jgi:hypothetical protein
LNPATTYFYRLRAGNSAGDSDWSNTANGATKAAPAIVLSTNGYKVKGKHAIDLVWSGAGSGSVDIVRNGTVIDTTTNDGAYTDNTGNKGSGTYVYAVCEADTDTCSDDSTVVF